MVLLRERGSTELYEWIQHSLKYSGYWFAKCVDQVERRAYKIETTISNEICNSEAGDMDPFFTVYGEEI